jgi:transcriptional regulator with XRE-family HTH domain
MEKLKRLRLERGLSQVKLGALAEVDPSTVNQVERGVREPSPATLRKLADVLGVSIAELLEEESPLAEAPQRQRSLNDELAAEAGLDVTGIEDLDIASILRINRNLTEEVLRAREEGDLERLDDLYERLLTASRAIMRKGIAELRETPAAARERRQRRYEVTEDAGSEAG